MSSESYAFIGAFLLCTNPKTIKVISSSECSLHPKHKVGSNASYCGECGAATNNVESDEEMSWGMMLDWDETKKPAKISMDDLDTLQNEFYEMAPENFGDYEVLVPTAKRFVGESASGEITCFNPNKLQCDMKKVRADLAPLVKLLKKYMYKSVQIKFGLVSYDV